MKAAEKEGELWERLSWGADNTAIQLRYFTYLMLFHATKKKNTLLCKTSNTQGEIFQTGD